MKIIKIINKKLILSFIIYNILLIKNNNCNLSYQIANNIDTIRKHDTTKNFFTSFNYFDPIILSLGVYNGLNSIEQLLEQFHIIQKKNRRRRRESIDKRFFTKVIIATAIILLKKNWNTNPRNLFKNTQSLDETTKDLLNSTEEYISKLPEKRQSIYVIFNKSGYNIDYTNQIVNEIYSIQSNPNITEIEKKTKINKISENFNPEIKNSITKMLK